MPPHWSPCGALPCGIDEEQIFYSIFLPRMTHEFDPRIGPTSMTHEFDPGA